MATAVAITEAYTVIVAGPVHVELQNQGRNPIKYRVATTGSQAATLAGRILRAGEYGLAYVATGQSLYAKVAEGTGVTGSVVYATHGANPA